MYEGEIILIIILALPVRLFSISLEIIQLLFNDKFDKRVTNDALLTQKSFGKIITRNMDSD